MDSTKKRHLPELPIGVQTFSLIRENGLLYVDKTALLAELASRPRRIFLCRPRRFGKSLTVSTLASMFAGKAELFKGLAAEAWLKKQAQKPNPVVWLDMSRMTDDSPETLRASLLKHLARIGKTYGVPVAGPFIEDALGDLIRALFQKFGPVVVLIDEYDKPVLDAVEEPQKAEAMRSVLASFYARLKGCDASLRFVMLTGISKFSPPGVFSSMNHLKDISMDARYGTIVGFTQEEIEASFAGWIDATAEKRRVSREELLSKMKDFYDGYSFDGVTKVYNPFSVLNFFDTAELDCYWYDTGSPSFLSRYFRTHRSESLETFSNRKVPKGFLSAREIEAASPESFLYQAGYLTMRARDEQFIWLDYPNKEVLAALSRLFLDTVYRLPDSENTRGDALAALREGNIGALIETFDSALAPIPYGDFSRQDEAFYRAIFTAVLRASGITCLSEPQSSKGRADTVVITQECVAVFEFKLGENSSAFDRLLEEAKRQMIDRAYTAPFENDSRPVHAAAVVIDGEKHEVARWEQIQQPLSNDAQHDPVPPDFVAERRAVDAEPFCGGGDVPARLVEGFDNE